MLSVLRSTCPFPTVDPEGTRRDGLNVMQPAQCSKCKPPPCRTIAAEASTRLTHTTCQKRFSVVTIPTQFGCLIVNGVLVPFQNTAMDAKARKEHRSQKVTWQAIQEYQRTLASSSAAVQAEIDRRATEAVSGLHDIKTAVNLVSRNAEAIVRNLPGADDYEKIERAEAPLKSLLKSVNLLNSRLSMASIVANPEAASYGKPRRTPVYRVFHRMERLFEEEAQRRKVWLRMGGNSNASPMLFDSFETIPLVLIDNAIKYSDPGTEVHIRVEDLPGRTDVCLASVESVGELVALEHRARIFERGFRPPNAKRKASSGSGLGLYIAKIVVDANGCSIRYVPTAGAGSNNVGTNLFSVTIGSLDVTKIKRTF